MGKLEIPICEQIYVRTPLVESVPLRPYAAGRKVFLKLENCQPSGSFKTRGISALCKYAREQGFTEVVCSSGGNAGLATAYSAMQLGMNCHIVVTRRTPSDVCECIRSYGATVEIFGDVWEEANSQAIKRTTISKTSYLVHPFDHPVLWEGHSKIIDEIAEDLGSIVPSMIVTCCGGGGLVCGLVKGVRRQANWQDRTKILVLETVGTDSFNVAVKAGGEPVRLDKITSIVTCLSANEVCPQILDDFKASKPPILSRLVSDQDAVQACVKFLDDHRFLVGTACGATLSSLYIGMLQRILNHDEQEHETIFDKANNLDYSHNTDGPVVVIICGGSEIQLDSLLELRKQFNC